MSVESRLEDNIRFLEKSNDFLSDEVQRLHELINEERKTNTLLLRRLGIIEEIKTETQLGEINPIGGFVPLRQRIRELEETARERLRKEVDEFNAMSSNNDNREE